MPGLGNCGERLLHRFQRGKVNARRKRFTGPLDMRDTIQAKQALSLPQVAVADGVPEPLVIGDTIGIERPLREF